MSLSLRQSQAISRLADYLYPFLPGNPHPFANQSVSFAGLANDLGLAKYWPGGSKLPAIQHLLSATLEYESSKFCPLMVEIVRRSIRYRQGKSPITREEIQGLNELLASVGFKIPELHDPRFLDGLPRTPRPGQQSRVALKPEQIRSLQNHLLELTKLSPERRGLEFEIFLGELFETFDLAPRGAFRLVGEQIDGSFQFQGETYLLEAKWHNHRLGNQELLGFSGGVGGKSGWSRGLLVSYSGFTDEGLDAFARGRATNIICMDGLDLHHVLQGQLDFRDVLGRKVRRAAETNRAFVPVRELFPMVI